MKNNLFKISNFEYFGGSNNISKQTDFNLQHDDFQITISNDENGNIISEKRADAAEDVYYQEDFINEYWDNGALKKSECYENVDDKGKDYKYTSYYDQQGRHILTEDEDRASYKAKYDGNQSIIEYPNMNNLTCDSKKYDFEGDQYIETTSYNDMDENIFNCKINHKNNTCSKFQKTKYDSITETKYDSNGNEVARVYYEPSKVELLKYDDHNNVINQNYYNINDGYGFWLTEERFNPMTCNKFVNEYDEQGRLIKRKQYQSNTLDDIMDTDWNERDLVNEFLNNRW